VALVEETLDKEAREDNRIVAGWLLYYHERKRDYENRREAILHSTPRPYEVSGGTNYISDATGRKGQKLADLREIEEWLALVEEVERRLPWKMQILLRLKRTYKRGARGRPVRWIIALKLSEEISERTRKDYSIGPDAVDEWWQKVVEYGARLAAKRGLL
jgi:hypothetical protein